MAAADDDFEFGACTRFARKLQWSGVKGECGHGAGQKFSAGDWMHSLILD
jgi:hypothetical protein